MRCPHCEYEFPVATRIRLAFLSKAACPSCGSLCYYEVGRSKRIEVMGFIILGAILGFSLVVHLVPGVLILLLLIAVVGLSAASAIRHGIAVKQHSDAYNRAMRYQRLGALSGIVFFSLQLALQADLIKAEGIQGAFIVIAMAVSLIMGVTFFFLAGPRYC